MDYINENPETLRELARAAYVKGDTDKSAMLETIADLIGMQEKAQETADELASLQRETADHGAYKSFFESCFERLNGHYPAPSVTSDYDCSVIFDAIEGNEND